MQDEESTGEAPEKKEPQFFDLAPLVQAALDDSREDNSNPMTSLMRAVAKATDSSGCVLWRRRSTKQNELILLAGWFDTPAPITLCRIQLEGTCAGKALHDEANGCYLDNDLFSSGNPNAHHPFLASHGINRTLACKVMVPKGDVRADGDCDPAWEGSLNLYRRGERPDSPEGLSPERRFDLRVNGPALEYVCKSIPLLFRATRNREALRLLQETAAIVSNYRSPAKPGDWETNLKETVEEFALALQRAFRSQEVSVFLRTLDNPAIYKCWHSTPGVHRDLAMRKRYRGSFEEGFSGLCLKQEEPIRVADIRHPEDEEQHYGGIYPKFEGHQRNGISKLVLAELGLKDEYAPPHSLICCRMGVGAEVLGFVRCRFVLQGPVVYHKEDSALLKQVTQSFSENLAAWWEAHRWEESVEGVAQYKALGSGKNEHLVEALELISKAVPGADVNTARMPDAGGENLVFVAVSTKAKQELVGTHAREGLARRFPLNPPAGTQSVGADVMRTGKAERFPISDPRYKNLFRDIKEVIIAPIIGHDATVFGVLDARTHSTFPAYALRLMEIIGRLVGAHHAYLLKALEDRKTVEERQKIEIARYQDQIETEKRNTQAFEDAAHQIKTPLQAARKHVEIVSRFRRAPNITLLETTLRRADLASKLINTFADIASGRPLHLSQSELIPEDVARLIRTLVADVLRTSEESRGLRFEFDEDSLLKHAPKLMAVDENLLSGAVYNLLENAEKYSYSRTLIRCYAGRSRSNRFFIAVTNKGERLEPHEANLCKQRRWRKTTLGWKSGSGSGLGLYIVDNIMIAHRGNLNIIPTRPDGITEVRLEFPID